MTKEKVFIKNMKDFKSKAALYREVIVSQA